MAGWRWTLLFSACQLAHEPPAATVPVVEVDHLGPVTMPGEDPPGTVSWAVQDPAIAEVDGGEIVAIGAGRTVVTATRGGQATRYELNVVPRTVLRFHEAPATLAMGGSAALEVVADSADGLPRRIIGASFHSSDPMVLRVSTTGEITAVQPGVAYVTAEGEGAEAVVEIEVPAQLTP